MPSIEFHTSNYDSRVTYDVSQSVDGNYSDITVTFLEIKNNNGYRYNVNAVGSITVNGRTAAKLTLSSTEGCPFNLSGTYTGGGSNFTGWRGYTVRVPHGGDGTAAFQIVVTVDLYDRSTGKSQGRASGSSWELLPAIPRVSQVTASGAKLGSRMDIAITRASPDFTDTVSWSCGKQSGAIAERTGETSLSWTPPVSLAAEAPAQGTVAIILTVTTYSGSTEIGSRSITVSCQIPDCVVPTVSIRLSDRLGYPATYGGYIQNQSQLRVQTDAQGAFGSTISRISVSCGGISGTGADLTLQLPNAGTATVNVVVTDSRGRTAAASASISVIAYENPSAAITELSRCDEAGQPQNDGNYAKLVFTHTVTGLNGRNVPTFRLLRRLRGEEAWSRLEITGDTVISQADADSSYEYRVEVTDAFTVGQSQTATLGVAFALMDFDRENRAAGILQRANMPGMLCIGGDTKHYGNRITDVGKPAALTDAATLDSAYPVGTVYMTVSEESPEVLFGGSWQHVEGGSPWTVGTQTVSMWVRRT